MVSHRTEAGGCGDRVMRICLATATFLPMVGGAEITVHNLAAALHNLGHEVVVVAPRYSASLRARVPYDLHTVLAGTLPFLARSERLGEIYFLANLALLRRRHFDVVNVQMALPLGPVFVRHRRTLSAPVVVTFQGTDIQKEPSIGYGLRLDSRLERRIRATVNGADGLVAISESIRQSALELLEVPKRIFDIPNGVDVRRFREAGTRGRFRRRLGLPDSTPLVLAVGRNHPKKGFRYLVDAMRLVTEAEPSVVCAFLGRGVGALRDQVEALGLTKRVLLVEELGSAVDRNGPPAFPGEEVIEAYKDSDILVSPSLIEGCSLVVIEALAAGLPVVAADAPGNRDAVEDGHNGLLCQPRDPEDLARKLLALVRDAQFRDRLARNAAESAQKYDWTEIAKEYVDAFAAVARVSDSA